ncbi:MAG: HEAT repeat domain-containing protein [Acidobacteriota bacterium]|nr:HEAT repeat domain-containing protein [Acidobacteriota bacterium]
MNAGTSRMYTPLSSTRRRLLLAAGVVLAAGVCTTFGVAGAQETSSQPANPPAKADGEVVGDEGPPPGLPVATTPEERGHAAWTLLQNAAGDAKHSQTRIEGLAAAGLLRSPQSEKIIVAAMGDPDVDVRTAAALAVGQSKDRNLTTNLRNLLDDKEPEVVYTAAMTLWKMGDKSGEDILMSVVDGDRSSSASLMHGTGHKLNRDLHDPAKMAKLGAIQGAYMILGPFGYGITAFNFIHQSGGDLSRVAAIEQISQERIEPVHQELIGALKDKDPTVRAAAAKAVMEYHDNTTQMAVYALLADPKQPVRLTAAAAYLRTTGTPGPETTATPAATERKGKRLQTPTSTKTPKLPK